MFSNAAAASTARRSSVSGIVLSTEEQAEAARLQQAPHHFPRPQAEGLATVLVPLARHPLGDQAARLRVNLRALSPTEQETAVPLVHLGPGAPNEPNQEVHAMFSYRNGRDGNRVDARLVTVNWHSDDGPAERLTTVVTDQLDRALDSRAQTATCAILKLDRAARGIPEARTRDSSPDA